MVHFGLSLHGAGSLLPGWARLAAAKDEAGTKTETSPGVTF